MIPAQSSSPSLRRWLLSRLMSIANSNPSFGWYSLKTMLLQRYGVQDTSGYDLQRIEATCYLCKGSGCRFCADGIHHITRTVLSRWFIEDRMFHQLYLTKLTEQGLQHYMPQAKSFITERVKHRPFNGRSTSEATLWLLLYVAPDIGWAPFWRTMNGSSYGTPGFYPLLQLQRLFYTVRFFPARIYRKWERLRARLYPWLIHRLTEWLHPRGSRGMCPQIAAQAAYFGSPSYRMEVTAVSADHNDIPF